MFEVLEGFLVDLRVKHIVHRIHLSLPVLLIHVALFLHLSHGVTVLLNVNLMRCALYSKAINFFAQLQDVALVLSKAALDATHPEIKCPKASRGFCTSQLCLLFHGPDLLKRLLLLLTDIILQPSLCVCNISLQVTPHNSYFIEAIAQRVLSCVETLLRCCQVLVCEIDATIQSIHSLVSVTGDLCL